MKIIEKVIEKFQMLKNGILKNKLSYAMIVTVKCLEISTISNKTKTPWTATPWGFLFLLCMVA